MQLTNEEIKALIPATHVYRDVTPQEAAAVTVDKFYVDQFGVMYLGCEVPQPQLQAREVL